MAGEERLENLPPKVLEAIRKTQADEEAKAASLRRFEQLAKKIGIPGDGLDNLIIVVTRKPT